MPYVSGKNSRLTACDIYGASFVISNDMNSIVLNQTKDNPTYTLFGASNMGRVVGIADTTLTGAGVWNADAPSASGVAQILQDMFSGSWGAPLAWCPAGSQSGSPLYNACMVLNSLEINAVTTAVVTFAFTFANAACGGVIAGSCV